MEAKGTNFSHDAKRAAVKLRKPKVPLENIREQLQMSERTLMRVLAAAKASPEDPVPKRKKTSGRPAKVMATTLQYLKNLVESMLRRLQAVIDGNGKLTK